MALDTDAEAWKAAVEATGATLVSGYDQAVSDMITGLKADGTWAKITDMHIMAGASTAAGALVQIKSSVSANLAITATNIALAEYIASGPDCGFNDYTQRKYVMGGGGTYFGLHIGAPTLTAVAGYGVWGGVRNGSALLTATSGTFPYIYQNSETTLAAGLYSFGGSDFTAPASTRLTGDVIAVRTSTSAGVVYLNGSQAATLSGASASSPGTGNILLLAASAGVAGMRRHTAYFIANGVSGAECLTIRTRINTALAALSYATGIRSFLYVGDSLTEGYGGATPYSTYIRAKSEWGGRHANVGLSGVSAASIATNISSLSKHLRPDSTYSTKSIALVWAGTNDLAASAAASTVLTSLRAIWSALRTDGYKVVAFTVAPRDDASWSGTKETERAALNALIVADSANWDVLVRVDTLFTNPADTTYFQADKLHLNSAGESALADRIDYQIDPAASDLIRIQPEVRRGGAGPSFYAEVNGQIIRGSQAEIFSMLRQLAEQHAEEDGDAIEAKEQPKKRAIRLIGNAPKVEQASETSVTVSQPILKRAGITSQQASDAYERAYATVIRRKAQEAAEFEEVVNAVQARRQSIAKALLAQLEALKGMLH